MYTPISLLPVLLLHIYSLFHFHFLLLTIATTTTTTTTTTISVTVYIFFLSYQRFLVGGVISQLIDKHLFSSIICFSVLSVVSAFSLLVVACAFVVVVNMCLCPAQAFCHIYVLSVPQFRELFCFL